MWLGITLWQEPIFPSLSPLCSQLSFLSTLMFTYCNYILEALLKYQVKVSKISESPTVPHMHGFFFLKCITYAHLTREFIQSVHEGMFFHKLMIYHFKFHYIVAWQHVCLLRHNWYPLTSFNRIMHLLTQSWTSIRFTEVLELFDSQFQSIAKLTPE